MAQQKSSSDNLHGNERRQKASNQPLRPLVIHEIVREEGEHELGRRTGALAWSGFAAGLSMGFSFLVLALLHAGLPAAPWRNLVDSFGYSTGFLIVILGRQQLFTETTLTAILPVLTRRDGRTFVKAMRVWAIVLVANLVGTAVFAAVIAQPAVFGPDIYAAFTELAHHTLSGAFWPVLVRSIFAGWLIAIMVWLLPGAGPSRPLIIILLTYVVGLGRLSHIIASSVESAFAVFAGQATVWEYLRAFWLPTLIGNTIGGVSLVALLNHAPLSSEIKENNGAR